MNTRSLRLVVALFAALPLSSCSVDPFCLTCREADAGKQGDGGTGRPTAGSGGTNDGGMHLTDGAVEGGTAGTGMMNGDSGLIVLPDGAIIPAECVGPELCNGKDDDCDGDIDEDFDFARNPEHCGGCDTACVPEHAFGACRKGECEIAACDVGAHDLNEDPADGCEYECVPVADDKDLRCDGKDDDCDGDIDEDIAFDTDPSNCGECNTECVLNNANASCGAGHCTFAGCKPGFVNADGDTEDGCELECVPADPAVEVCNRRDDDCDADVDEGDPGGGVACGISEGECNPGIYHCVNGLLRCEGAVVNPTTELCNGKDDDCDGVIDNGNPEGGRFCGSTAGVCTQGRESCVGGKLECDFSSSVVGTDEICDGLDNDCDGTPDDGNPEGGADCGSSVGECEFGKDTCANGAIECVGGVTPKAELCNDKDDDCDGVADNDNPQGGGPCGISTGECNKGHQLCVAGQLTCPDDIEPVTEICDGFDNDCDGAIDNGAPTNGACGDPDGECGLVPGVFTCIAGKYVCVGDRRPVDEKCNGKDDNCDGSADEGNPQGGSACGSGTGQCVKGTEICQNGQLICPDDIEPVTEICDGYDNDCNGVIDNGISTNGDCGEGGDEGECTFGALTCVGGKFVCVGGQRPVDELCNGKDDDCDTETDEDNPEGGQLCGLSTGQCVKGHQQCVDGVLECPDDVEPSTELCNGLDDDCDGAIDDGVPTSGACGNTQGACGLKLGAMTCVGGTYICVGDTKPDNEKCDNLDNDCDGVVDDGLQRSCGTNTGECSVGTETCSAGGWVGCSAVQPAVEQCDNLDNDCDGNIDNGNPEGGAACGTDVGACEFGAQVCLNGALACQGGIIPIQELCDGVDNDCDGTPDNGNPQSGAACGSDVGQCKQGITSCQSGDLVCTNTEGPFTEECNGLDDDCDGVVDDNNPEGGADCGIDTGECSFGEETCQGGTLVCVGGQGPAAELCDTKDNNCNGSADETFSFGTDINHCGTCSTVCTVASARPSARPPAARSRPAVLGSSTKTEATAPAVSTPVTSPAPRSAMARTTTATATSTMA